MNETVSGNVDQSNGRGGNMNANVKVCVCANWMMG